MRIRTYSELCQFETFEERYDYLQLKGVVGASTFGHDRYINQAFYTSAQWREVRNEVIARDEARDLGSEGQEIHGKIIIHHMNPIVANDIVHGDSDILNPEYLITTTHRTHNAIHYGDRSLLPAPMIVRQPGDTGLFAPRFR